MDWFLCHRDFRHEWVNAIKFSTAFSTIILCFVSKFKKELLAWVKVSLLLTLISSWATWLTSRILQWENAEPHSESRQPSKIKLFAKTVNDCVSEFASLTEPGDYLSFNISWKDISRRKRWFSKILISKVQEANINHKRDFNPAKNVFLDNKKQKRIKQSITRYLNKFNK